MKKYLIILSVFIISNSGCAWTPQAVVLKPDIQTGFPSIAKGQQVLLTVVDERPRSTLGTRGAKGIGAELTVKGDLTNVVRKAVADGLQSQGFVVTSDKPADGRELRVEIRNLDYGVTVGFWAGTLRTECSLKGICIIGSTRPYEHLYLGEHQESVQVVQSEDANEKYLNIALSKAINLLLQDPRISQTLTK